MNHARTAAVLRAGQQVGRLDGDSKYAIDLSSERARRAGRLVDEIRNGQPLGALLGYQFEKGLDDSGLPELQLRLHKLRNRFPLVPNKRSDDPYQEIDAVAARDVVDGNLLLTTYKASPQSILNDPSLPKLGPTALAVLTAELDRLKETMDAVADLVHAEAAFQVVQADVASAQANLDFLPHGQNPPEPAILNTDGGGISLTQRVALLFTQSPAEGQDWPPAGGTARSAADPLIDAWLSLLLGDPRQLTATVTYKDKAGAPQPPETVAVADLGLRPLDIIALAHAAADPNQASLLDRRILFKAFVPDWTSPLLTYNRTDGARPGSIAEMLEMARAIGAVLANARPLSRDDLHVPAEVDAVGEPPQGEADAIVTRAQGAVSAIDAVVAALSSPTTVVDGMVRAAQFLPNSFPLPGASADSLSLQKTGVIAELQRRRDAAIAALPTADPKAPPPPDPPPPSETIAAARSALQAIFGADFVGLTGIGSPPSPDEVAKSLAARSTLIASDGVLDQFVQQTARVREGMGRWRRATLYARALGQAKPRLDVLQLPHTPAETWVGNSVPSTGGKVSILLVAPTGTAAPPTDATANWSGLFLDQWVETVPLPERETGVAFHYDHPNAEAPQAILIAVRSGAAVARAEGEDGWSWDELLATVNETFDLTHIRTVEPQHLPLGQVLPAIHLASNQQGYTPSTNFVEQMTSPPTQGNS